MQGVLACRYFRRAFGWCVPIGTLGGFIGLGGGEFRLPVLMYAIGYDARSAVPLNLLISLLTLAFSLAVRSRSVSLAQVVPHLPEMIGLLAGGMASAFYRATLVSRLSNERLVLIIGVLLAALGVSLMTEACFPLQTGDLLPAGITIHILVGAIIGIAVGLVSSLLGVAGGELLIPVFGADIK